MSVRVEYAIIAILIAVLTTIGAVSAINAEPKPAADPSVEFVTTCQAVDAEVLTNLRAAGVATEYEAGTWKFDGEVVGRTAEEDEAFLACGTESMMREVAIAQP